MSTNNLPPSLISNLQNVLMNRKGAEEEIPDIKNETQLATEDTNEKPIILVTNCDGINSPGLQFLVEALVRDGNYNVYVCAPDSDMSCSAHSVTQCKTIAASSTEMNGATTFEVSGTPVDCVSLALSGALFSWSRPALVVSGISMGPSTGNHIIYSGAIAGAREALMAGIPSISISLNWKKNESKDSDFKEAVDVCLPLIHTAIRDTDKGLFPKNCLVNIEFPSSPSAHKGFKVTRQSTRGPALNWQAVSANRNPAAGGQYMSMHQSLGVQLAQISQDASAAGAARRAASQKKNVEVESIATAKPETQHGAVKKYFRLEFGEKEFEDLDEDLDFRAVENGFVAVTPVQFNVNAESEIQASTSEWLASFLTGGTEEAS